MILTSIGQAVAMKWFRFMTRFKYKARIISIFDYLNSASRVCLCLPCEEDFDASLISIDQLRQIFPNAHITLLHCTSKPLPEKFHAFRIVDYNPQKTTLLGMPEKKLRHDIAISRFDVMIDLSLSFSYVNAALTWLSGAGLRICFHHPRRDHLYNFVVRLDTNSKWEKSYQQLMKYLGVREGEKTSVNS